MRPVRKKKDVCNIYENPVPYVLIGNPDKVYHQNNYINLQLYKRIVIISN